MSPEALFARVAGLAGIALTLLHAGWLVRDLRDARSSLETRASLRRLAALTIRNFPARDLDSPDLFWKSIGREDNPMRDTWGTEYRLTAHGEAAQRSLLWASAGPDRAFGTRDDIVVEVPYPSGPGSFPELAPGEPAVPPPVSFDAK